MLIDAGRDRIRTLRAVGAQRDPLALRLSLERTLGAAELRPRGLPPSAILCVRRMRVAIRARSPVEWTSGLDRQVAQLLPGIARPFREAVPADAIAVLFADESELLACLSRDWARGAPARWWWHSLFGAALSEPLVERAFEGSSMFVPAALEMLAGSRDVTDVLRALPAAICERMAESVATTFGATAWTESASHSRAPFDESVAAELRAQQSDLAPHISGAIAAAVGDCASTIQALPVAQRTLLTLALALRRAPALAREPDFARALREHASGSGAGARTADAPVVRRVHDAAAGDGQARSASRSRVMPAQSPNPGKDDGSRELDAPGDQARVRDAPATMPGRPVRGDPHEPHATVTTLDAALEPPESRTVLRTARAPDPAHQVESAFAGVFYLVNLAIYLELYGDFTQPARPGLSLPPGDFLALVGERACGVTLREDPVWDVLAQISNRSADESPGAAFMAPGPLAIWLDATVQGLEARAARALGVEEGSALPFLCARAGRIALTAARVDVTFSLAAHPLAIRIAGLDRNPGWLPAAGRVFELHYE